MILILSDSHNQPINLDLSKYDSIIHAGDFGISFDMLKNNNVYFVLGNCDFRYDLDSEKQFEIENKKIFLTHGHLYRVKETLNNIYFKAKSLNIDICIFGHTHIQTYFKEDNITFINPGAYKDGYYAIIDNNNLLFYKDNKLINKYNL